MDASPTGPTLPTATAGIPKVLGPKQLLSTPLQSSRPARTADQFDAMAKVEQIHQRRGKYREQYKAVIAQRDVEMVEINARWQKEAAQKLAEYQEHFKRMESHLNQVPSNQRSKNEEVRDIWRFKQRNYRQKTKSWKNSLQHKRKVKRN